MNRLEILSRLKKYNKGVTYLSKIHSRSRQRIYEALDGKANELLSKILKHIDYLESKNGESK